MAPADKVSLKPWLKRINNFDRIIWSLENDLNLFRIWPYRNPSLKMTHTIWIISKKSAKTYKFSKFRMWDTDLWWVLVEWFAPECNFDLTWPVFTEKKKSSLDISMKTSLKSVMEIKILFGSHFWWKYTCRCSE